MLPAALIASLERHALLLAKTVETAMEAVRALTKLGKTAKLLLYTYNYKRRTAVHASSHRIIPHGLIVVRGDCFVLRKVIAVGVTYRVIDCQAHVTNSAMITCNNFVIR